VAPAPQKGRAPAPKPRRDLANDLTPGRAAASASATPPASSAPLATPAPPAPQAIPAKVAPPPSAPAAAAASTEPPPAPIAIDFESPASGAWFVSGLEDVVREQFRRFHSVDLAAKLRPDRCPGRDPHCLVAQYAAGGVQVVVLGELEGPDALAYRVYDTWTGTRAFEGALRFSGTTTPALERQIGDLIRPIVQRGGLLDQRPPPSREPLAGTGPLARSRSAAGKSALLLLLGVSVAFVSLPVLLAFALVGMTELRRRPTPASWKWSALLAAVLSTACIAFALFGPSPRAIEIVSHWPLVGRLASVAAGVLWAVFALATGVWVFAPVHGLERIRHDALWPLLRSWMALALLRAAALLVLQAPLFFLLLRAGTELGMRDRVTWACLPASGLLAQFCLLSLVDNLSVYLDAALVSGPPTARNPWHGTLKRYFRGYVRRGVIGVAEKLIERTLFLPGSRADVVCYGGGFARPRIVVGQRPMEAALGELPDEEEIPDRTANPEELPFGILVPSRPPEAALARAESVRRSLTLSPPRPRAHVPRLIGENATLLGWVLPQPTEKGIPLISDTEEDFGVVKRLLSEHYGAFAATYDGDEVDDTDPTQKDFLFGALLREMGIVARHDVIFATLGLFVEVVAARSGWLAAFVRLPLTLYENLFAVPAARVADAYAALNGALHPLIQYLCFVRGGHAELLTARASAPRLMQTSREMVARLAGRPPTAAERSVLRVTPRDRCEWLARVFYEPLSPPRVRWVRIAGGVALAAAFGALLVRYVSDAIAYHPTYAARMQSLATAITEGEKR
jgi:hypothetical protein